MRFFIITQSEADLTSHAGRGLIGMALNECINLVAEAEAASPLRSDAMSRVNILSTYIALLCFSKSDFEVVTGFREDTYFAEALGLDQVPSEGALRQRMDLPRASSGSWRQRPSSFCAAAVSASRPWKTG